LDRRFRNKEQDIVRVAAWLMPKKADVEDSTGQTFCSRHWA
jgi:hypothetical protein